MNARGVAVDLALVKGALCCGMAAIAPLKEEAKLLTGLINPNSSAQLLPWLRGNGVQIENLQKQTILDLLDGAGNTLPPVAVRVLRLRQEVSKASLKKYDALVASVCDDGRVRGMLLFYGANRTGRWSGKMVQMQNLPRTYIGQELLSIVRDITKQQNTDALQILFESLPDTLSQLIRTAFVAAPGKTFVDADFSAIEARVVAWLAGEEWVLQVFRTHGRIYEATAAQLYGVPMERIRKGNAEYALRQYGKAATLALGYAGGTSALIKAGQMDKNTPVEELLDIRNRWRSSNGRIVQLWRDVERAALTAIKTGQQTAAGRCVFRLEGDGALTFLTVQLPSGRKLYYAQPGLGVNQFGKETITYMGTNQTSKRWEQQETYGGKLVENCLAKGTMVLTDKGLVPIEMITANAYLWDGVHWVRHKGLVSKGIQETIQVDGVSMTPDHLVLTEKGWRNASSSKRYNRHRVKSPNCAFLCWLGRKKVSLERAVRLWESHCNACYRIFKGQDKIMRVQEIRSDRESQYATWKISHENIRRVAFYEGTLHLPNCTSMGKLWRPGNPGLRALAGQLRGILQRYASDLSRGALARQDRCRWGLLPGKLSVGVRQGAEPEQTKQYMDQYSLGVYNRSGSGRKERCFGKYATLSDSAQRSGKFNVCETGCAQQVYDLKDAGPHHRFAIQSNAGLMLVHNCTQAVARDCLAESITRLEAAGYPIVFHIHDEIVAEIENDRANLDAVVEIMSQPISWAPGLPLAADGWTGEFFRKD